MRTAARAQLVSDARADPVVSAVLSHFPGAEIVDVRVREAETGGFDAAEAGLIAETTPEDD